MADSFLDRRSATAYLRDKRGVVLGEKGLENMATRGTGPVYSLINGSALYLPADLNAWVDEERVANRRTSAPAA